MNKSTGLFILLTGGFFLSSVVSVSPQNLDVPQDQNHELNLNNEKKEQSDENSNLEENPSTLQEIEKQKILENAKVYQCIIRENDIIQVAILENGDTYLFYDNVYNKILLEEINPEDVYIVCRRNEIIFEYKKPLSNIKHQKIFKLKDNEVELIGSKRHDQIQDYIEELFLKALEGKKTEILKLSLKNFSFSYQYINNESINHLLNEAIEKSNRAPTSKAVNIFEATGILITKLVYYYQFNEMVSDDELLDFKKWISALEQVGIENYENFFIQYAETLLKLNAQNGLEILKYLTQVRENHIDSYIILGNYFWLKNQKDKAKEYYKKALEKSKMQLDHPLSNENNQNISKIPEYIYVRLSE